MALSLTAHKVTEAHCTECHEAEVQRLKVTPALHDRVEGRSTTCDHQDSNKQHECDLIHGRLPLLISSEGTRMGRLCMAPDYQVTQDHYDSLQEEIKEEHGSGATEQTVENKHDLPGQSGWGCHSKSLREINILL